LMTACDLSGGTKPWNCHYRVLKLIFFKLFKIQI
jgi:hypothetical protein